MHGLSVRLAADARPPLAAGAAAMAGRASKQVARGVLARSLPLGHTKPSRSGIDPPGPRGSFVGYFAAALVIDGVFRGASFCKYVCPIGQFNFVQSQVSPLEVRVRDPHVCTTCRTKDCIRGRDDLPGCELGLFQPRKVGNLDCTFCLDCVHSCPHENVGILPRLPGSELAGAGDKRRSGIGRLSRRFDLAALMLVVVYGGFANAAGMVGPVLHWQDQLRQALGLRSPFWATSLYYLAALIVLPLLVHGLTTVVCRWIGRLEAPWLEVAAHYAYCLVPLGAGIWSAHMSLHFFTSFGSLLPAAQRFTEELGLEVLGMPDWTMACCRPVGEWLIRLEIVLLDMGLLLSLYTAYAISRGLTQRPILALKALGPWALLIVLLYVAGIWIVFQPMQMRGTLAQWDKKVRHEAAISDPAIRGRMAHP